MCLHTSFASHSVPSFSLSAATPLSALSPTHQTFCSANTAAEIAAANSSVSSSSPLLSCMHTAQLTQFTRPIISSPVSSFVSAPLTSPLTQQTKSTFEENLVRSSMRPPYLQIVTGMSYREAFEFLKSKKHDISPNIGFVLALRELAAGNDFSVSSSN